MSYYRKFKIVIGSPPWRVYLRWAYNRGIKDLTKLKFKPLFNKKDFTALLCGVGNEVTADEFIKFVVKKNSKAKIIIIDMGEEQINAVKNLVESKYSEVDIQIKKIDALQLNNFISEQSIDWIETDGFLEYFNNKNLVNLLKIWAKILKAKGFITLRDFVNEKSIDKVIDKFRIWLGKKWPGAILFPHSKKEIEDLFKKNSFIFHSDFTLIPTFKRYSLVKSSMI